MKRDQVIGIITARGGSKGIPGKNLAPVAGRPLIAWTIEAALKSAFLERVIVSTDDPEIAEVSRRWGAEVPFLRPSELARDTSPHIPVVQHAVAWLEERNAIRPEYVVLLQPTSPLRSTVDIDAAIGLARETGASSVVTVRSADHPSLVSSLSQEGRMTPFAPAEGYLRRQDIPPAVANNGAVYVVGRDMLMEGGRLWDEHTLGLPMPAERCVDVDELHDLRVADALLRARVESCIPSVSIEGREVGPGHPCMVIAEAGVNHNGSLERALAMVDAAAEAGADAVKFQTFRAEELASPEAPKAQYQSRTTGGGTQLDMLRSLELSRDDHEALMERCRDRGILFMSSGFGPDDVAMLAELGVAAYKIPSGELVNHELLALAASKGRPLIVSTGMADLARTREAVGVVRAAGCETPILLHCVSAYPADPADANLRAMETLRLAFGVPTGFSDHTPGINVAVAAAALGACVIEKHFTLDRTLPGPDHAASIEPDELAELVRGVREAQTALGTGAKVPVEAEADTASVALRSLVAARAIKAGEIVDRSMLALRRPGTGLPPSFAGALVGRVAVRDIGEGVLLAETMFEGGAA